MSVAVIVGVVSLVLGFGVGSGTAAGFARARAQMECLERATANGLDQAMAHRVCSRGRLRAARQVARALRRGRV